MTPQRVIVAFVLASSALAAAACATLIGLEEPIVRPADGAAGSGDARADSLTAGDGIAEDALEDGSNSDETSPDITGNSPEASANDAGDASSPDARDSTFDGPHDVSDASGPEGGVVVWATGLRTLSAIAVDSKNVYWTTGTSGTVMACPIAGCGLTPTTLVMGESSTNGLAVDEPNSNLYWTNSVEGTVKTCPLLGCNGAATTIASGQGRPGAIVIGYDRTFAYWVNSGGGNVMSCELAPTHQLMNLATGQATPTAVTADSSNVYWTNGGGSVMRCSVPTGGCGGSPTTLAATQSKPLGIVYGSTRVYWTENNEGGTGAIMECPINNPVPVSTLLSSAPGGPWGLAIDPGATSPTLWTGNTGGTVMKCNDPCMAPTTLASGQNGPTEIAIGGANVYWINQGSGQVMKAPR